MSGPSFRGVSFCFGVDPIDDLIEQIGRDTVDVSITSPPYKLKDGYSVQMMEALGRVYGAVLKPGGRVFLNFGQAKGAYERPSEARDAVLIGAGSGLRCGPEIAWIKSIAVPEWRKPILSYLDGLADGEGCDPAAIRQILAGPGEVVPRGHVQPLNSAKCLYRAWEPIFTLYKPPEPDFDQLAIGVPYADETNLQRGTRGKNGNIRCRGDTWFLPYTTTGQTTKKRHEHEFPESLVEFCLKVGGARPGQVVFEPFLGSGTTPIVAKRFGLHAVGTDQKPALIEQARSRWQAA